ncbi:hypothetical protein AB1Y20_018893 [Prymnesium parvum]|uniref:Uncharacterized protein n=1 Tax=Prymnesium parvum TaxID=97485 RepID=A0AB34JSL9_PRYPA
MPPPQPPPPPPPPREFPSYTAQPASSPLSLSTQTPVRLFTSWGSYVAEGFHHFKRAAGFTHSASAFEEREIERYCGTINTVAVFEFIVWRRSTLLLCIIFSLVTPILAFVAAAEGKEKVDAMRESANSPTNLTEYMWWLNNTNFTFAAYTTHVTVVALDSARVDVELVNVYLDIVIASLLFVSWAVTVLSAHYWANYSYTRKLLLVAWLISFLAPFAVSVVPTRYFASWDRFEEVSTDYILGFAQYFNLEERAAQAVAACVKVEESAVTASSSLQDIRSAVRGMCSFLRSIDNGASNFFSGNRIGRARDMCDNVETTVSSQALDSALEISVQACAEIKETLQSTPTGALLDLAATTVRNAKSAGSLFLGLSQGLLAFKVMAPSAIAMGPGILQGAIRVKDLVPQSSIPGMLVVLLPWLYSPLAWAIYNTFSQAIGSTTLLLGLLLLACGPLGYIAIGSYYDVPSPMTRTKYNKVKKILAGWGSLINAIANTIILLFLVRLLSESAEGPRERVRLILRSFITPKALINIFFATSAKILLTAVAGVDLMTGHIARQREFEVMLASDGDPMAISVVTGFRILSPEQKKALNEMMQQREVGLDDLRRITRVNSGRLPSVRDRARTFPDSRHTGKGMVRGAAKAINSIDNGGVGYQHYHDKGVDRTSYQHADKLHSEGV